jgi:predicted nuclease with RNAse H fold
MPIWVGVDVGAQRKGFHVAALDERRVVHGPVNVASVAGTVDLLVSLAPLVTGIDCPCRAAPPGARSRACERRLAAAVCGIRYTPDADALVEGGSYYEWIRNGLALYGALAAAERPACRVVEVFPTASWTRLGGPRGSVARGAWSDAALRSLELEGLPARRLGQDDRDAIAAAWTARLCSVPGAIEWFGEIAVPAQSRIAGTLQGALQRY